MHSFLHSLIHTFPHALIHTFLHSFMFPFLTRGEVEGLWAGFLHELIDQSNVSKRPPSHDCIITTTSSVRVELPRSQTGRERGERGEGEGYTPNSLNKTNRERGRQAERQAGSIPPLLPPSHPREPRYRAAGEVREMEPAGLMWSVVTLSPRLSRTAALVMSPLAGGSLVWRGREGEREGE